MVVYLGKIRSCPDKFGDSQSPILIVSTDKSKSVRIVRYKEVVVPDRH